MNPSDQTVNLRSGQGFEIKGNHFYAQEEMGIFGQPESRGEMRLVYGCHQVSEARVSVLYEMGHRPNPKEL